MRYFYDVSGLLFSFAVIPLLLATVFRCYFAAVGFKKPEFLRPSEVLPLYFPALSAISASAPTGDPSRRAVACAPRLTLDALWQGRVSTLAVDDTFCKPGSDCRNCGGLRVGSVPRCPVCGSDPIEAVVDMVELAIEHALEEKSALEIVRSNTARPVMASVGPMAALLRW